MKNQGLFVKIAWIMDHEPSKTATKPLRNHQTPHFWVWIRYGSNILNILQGRRFWIMNLTSKFWVVWNVLGGKRVNHGKPNHANMGGHFYIMPFPGFPSFIWSHDHHIKWMLTMWDKSYCPWQRKKNAPPTVVLPDFSARNPHPFWLHFAPTSEGSQPVWSEWRRLGQARKGRPTLW